MEARNTADSLVYNAEKLLRDNADAVPADLKEELEGKIAELREALQGQDTALINQRVQELQESLQKVGQAVYSQAGGPPPGAAPDDPGGFDPEPPPEGTIEGEYREV